MPLKNTKARREVKRKNAEARHAEYAKLSLTEKLARNTPNGKVAKKLNKAAEEAKKASKK